MTNVHTQEYPPHPRNPHVELRVLLVPRPGQDFLADAWNNKLVLVTGWFLSWSEAGRTPNGLPFYTPHWSARILEVPDRLIPEEQLRRVL